MKEGNINYCYNIGTIELEGNATWSAIGGISGRVKDGDVKSCYNNSSIITSQDPTTSSLVIGQIIGQLANSGKATNCAYKTGMQNSGIGIKSDGCIDETEGLDDLPDILSIIGNEFKDDTNNINNGYPILTWQ